MNYFLFILFGYLSGSVLYAYLIPKYFCRIDIIALSSDHNPGTFNAFHYAGKEIGTLVVLLELVKGFLPVYAAAHSLNTGSLLFGLVLAAPVIGHAFPLFHFRTGGKAIAVSFGCLLGLCPNLYPVLLLAVFYLLFSLIIVIRPHLLRSVVTYFCFSVSSIRHFHTKGVLLGALIISATVTVKHLLRYEKEPVSVRFGISRNH